MTLTGRTRYRSTRTWFGREYLILQVEVEGFVATNLGYCVDCETRRWWRDATTEDLTSNQITARA